MVLPSLRARPARLAVLVLALVGLLLAAAPLPVSASESEAAEDSAPRRPRARVPDFSSYTPAQVEALSFYDLLGVASDADTKAIKQNFRTISLKQHPDKAKTEEDKRRREALYPRFTLASDTLSNERKRLNYDHLLSIGKNPAKITSHDIDSAWDEERQMWASDYGWGFLEAWHALVLVFAISGAAVGWPIYVSRQRAAGKDEAKKRQAAEQLAKLQAIAAKAKALQEAESAKAAAKKAQAEAHRAANADNKKAKTGKAHPAQQQVKTPTAASA
jgi:curved DNA-binding protein CbpA